MGVTVGRETDCVLPVVDPLVSKAQCTFYHTEVSGWTLVDGAMKHRQPSTNGTWLYASEDFEIYSGMVLKFSETLLEVRLTQATLS